MNVAILGLGTVGSGVLKVLQDNQAQIQEQIGEPIVVTHIFGSALLNLHQCDLSNIKLVTEIEDLYEEPIDLVIEVLGGIDFTYNIHKTFLSKGIHVVSANKDMLAQHIDELAKLGNKNQAQIGYEATSAGGVPIIHNLQYTLRANRITRLLGILNGTTNYILSKMTLEGLDFTHALSEASMKGYAEADPTNDVDGYDAQRKLTLLSRLAFNRKIELNKIPVQGIRDVKVQDIEIGLKHGYVLKLLGMSAFTDGQLEASVQPAFLPQTHQLAAVSDAMNGVFVNGDAVGETMFYGPGAGSLETASAIVADVMHIAQFGFTNNFIPKNKAEISDKNISHAYYLRFNEMETDVVKTLTALDISYEKLAGEHPFTIVSAPLYPEQLQKLLENVNVAAKYMVLNEEN